MKLAERDKVRLAEVQEKLRRLSIVSRDDFNLPARHTALVALEAILLERVTGSRRRGGPQTTGSDSTSKYS
jgi:hypothetical protein